ncbi:MAG: hypothetical protein HON94_12340 [Methylococcales bacterium]|jgi:chemotaxis protein CheC|nr:hypothetical protein [Methylococcales bacterium]MBT7408655.1 hypothetical protein [Methylococcales bacterium]
MDNRVFLSELEEDFLGELFNMGVGKSANALSQMLGQTIEMTVPDIEVLPIHDFNLQQSQYFPLCCVSQQVSGAFDAVSMLVFPHNTSLNVVAMMMGEQLPAEALIELQEEAMSEMGNVVLNACMGDISNVIGDSIFLELPTYRLAISDLLIDEHEAKGDVVIHMNIKLIISSSKESGSLLLILDPRALPKLKVVLNNYINAYS